MKIKIRNSETIVLSSSLLLLFLIETNLTLKFDQIFMTGLMALLNIGLLTSVLSKKRKVLAIQILFILKISVIFAAGFLFNYVQILLLAPLYFFLFFPYLRRGIQYYIVSITFVLIALSNLFFQIDNEIYLIAILGNILAGIYLLFTIRNDKLTNIQDSGLQEKVLREKFQQLSLNSLSTVASGIAHEINNPLMIVKGSASIIHKKALQNKYDQENFIKHAETIEKTVDRISKIVVSLKNLSRNGTIDDKEPFLFKELWDDIEGLLSTKIKISEIELKIPKDNPLFNEIVFAQRVPLGQVFLNLIKNAYDATLKSEKRWIEIQFEKDQEDHLVVRVIDSGKGLDKEEAIKIFNPFFTTKSVGQGLGLGLSLCHSIMKSNDGSIEYDSECTNTCFVVKVPLFKHKFS